MCKRVSYLNFQHPTISHHCGRSLVIVAAVQAATGSSHTSLLESSIITKPVQRRPVPPDQLPSKIHSHLHSDYQGRAPARPGRLAPFPRTSRDTFPCPGNANIVGHSRPCASPYRTTYNSCTANVALRQPHNVLPLGCGRAPLMVSAKRVPARESTAHYHYSRLFGVNPNYPL